MDRVLEPVEYAAAGIFTAGDVLAVPGLDWAKVAVDDLTDED